MTQRGRTLMAAVAGMKPAGFSGYPGGRPVMAASGPAVESGLSMGGGSPLQQAVLAAAAPSRATDLTGLGRRKLRQAAGIGDTRTASAAQLAWARENGLLGGGGEAPTQRSIGSQLANIRWHGNPDGPASVLDAARRARLPRDPFADLVG